MEDEKYVLSGTCKILKNTEFKSENSSYPTEMLALKKGEAFILERKGNWYLINPTIKTFLKFFELPVQISTVIEKLSVRADCDSRQIERVVNDFLKQMLAQKIIIPESKYQNNVTDSPESSQKIVNQTIIANYRFEKRIFANQKIEIYKAISLANNLPVAIKILKRKIQKKDTIQSFAQEFFLLSELGQHPHICQFIELVQTKNISFGVLEFVDGLPGRKYIRKTQLNLSTKLHLLTQFFDAMAFMHRQGFLHGDLHLSNLLIDTNFYLKIIDFNMSNRANPEKNEIIREGGVHQYIAPEKLDSRVFKIVNGPANFASEVYQMGIIAYFFLYEKMPFAGFTWKDLAKKIIHAPVIYDRKTPQMEDVDPLITTFIDKMLHKIPEKRFPTANFLNKKWKKLISIIPKKLMNLNLQEPA